MTLPRKHESSRAERRSEKRLSQKMTMYDNAIKLSKNGGVGYTKPGKGKHW